MITALLRFLRIIWRDAQLYAMVASDDRLRRLNKTLQVAGYATAFGTGWCAMEIQEHPLWALVTWLCFVTMGFCLAGKVVVGDELDRRCAEALDILWRLEDQETREREDRSDD